MLRFLSKPVEPGPAGIESETVSQAVDGSATEFFSQTEQLIIVICFKSWVLAYTENPKPSVASSNDTGVLQSPENTRLPLP